MLPSIVHVLVAEVVIASATFSDVAGTPSMDIDVSWTSSAAAYCELTWKDPSVCMLRVGEGIVEFFFKRD